MAINPISFQTPQAFSGGVDFSPLANLGNVYRQGQQQAMQQQALSQLGNDPVANTQMLIKSGVPELAQVGVQMQNRLATQAEATRQFNLEQGVREGAAKLAREKFETDSPEYRETQVDNMIKSGVLPPEVKHDKAWQAYIATGQNMPSAAIAAPQTAADRASIRAADDQVEGAKTSLNALDRMDTLVDQAIHAGPLTKPIGYAASFLPEGYGGTSGTATQLIRNEALQSLISGAKSAFGSQPSNREDAWLLEAQASSDKSYSEQKAIIQRGRELMKERLQYNRDKATELRGGTYYGSQHREREAPTAPSAVAPTQTPAPAAAPAQPTLKEFMDKARAANPGYSDSEIAQEWNKRYGKKTATAPAVPTSF